MPITGKLEIDCIQKSERTECKVFTFHVPSMTFRNADQSSNIQPVKYNTSQKSQTRTFDYSQDRLKKALEDNNKGTGHHFRSFPNYVEPPEIS